MQEAPVLYEKQTCDVVNPVVSIRGVPIPDVQPKRDRSDKEDQAHNQVQGIHSGESCYGEISGRARGEFTQRQTVIELEHKAAQDEEQVNCQIALPRHDERQNASAERQV